MGSLKPGVNYIYEHANGVTYSREFGSDPNTRKVIGYSLEQQAVNQAFQNSIHSEDEESRKWRKKYEDEALWQDIRQTAETHPSLLKILDNAIIMYRLIKNNPA